MPDRMTEERLAKLERTRAEAILAVDELLNALRAERAALERERQRVRVLLEFAQWVQRAARQTIATEETP